MLTFTRNVRLRDECDTQIFFVFSSFFVKEKNNRKKKIFEQTKQTAIENLKKEREQRQLCDCECVYNLMCDPRVIH